MNKIKIKKKKRKKQFVVPSPAPWRGGEDKPPPQSEISSSPHCGTKTILPTNPNPSAEILWDSDFPRMTGQHRTR
jgi:hypothetical protein